MKWLLTLLLITYNLAFAFEWKNFWLRSDQQGARLLAQGRAAEAATRFQNPDWRGVAAYRAKNFDEAVDAFSQSKTPESYYNQGNALALSGQYQEALNAYEQTLNKIPTHADAKFNYELVKKLLKNQQNQNKNQNQNQNQNQQQNQNQDQKQNKSSNNDQPRQGKNDKENNKNQNQQHSQNNDKEGGSNKNDQKSQPKPPPPTNTQASQSESSQKENPDQRLQQIPDDPGGLLKRKFLRDYQKRHA